jgi:hypothetical protein
MCMELEKRGRLLKDQRYMGAFCRSGLLTENSALTANGIDTSRIRGQKTAPTMLTSPFAHPEESP